jgi:hypothetical protein
MKITMDEHEKFATILSQLENRLRDSLEGRTFNNCRNEWKALRLVGFLRTKMLNIVYNDYPEKGLACDDNPYYKLEPAKENK